MPIRLTTPDYDEFYEFDTELECKHFLISGITDAKYWDTRLSISELLSHQDEYVIDDCEDDDE